MKGRGLGTFEKEGWKGRSGNQRLVWTGPSGGRGCEGSLWRVSRRSQKTYLLSLPPHRQHPSTQGLGIWGPELPWSGVQTLFLCPW